jgi:hypothetical protein
MSKHLQWRNLAALSTLAVTGAFAQPVAPVVPTQPQSTASAATAPSTQASTTPYRSVFGDFQPFAEEKVLPWKEANDTVRANGGWREYAKEANEESGKPQSSPATPAAPAAGRAKP